VARTRIAAAGPTILNAPPCARLRQRAAEAGATPCIHEGVWTSNPIHLPTELSKMAEAPPKKTDLKEETSTAPLAAPKPAQAEVASDPEEDDLSDLDGRSRALSLLLPSDPGGRCTR